MATSYTLNFSDPSKTATISIQGATRNNYDTSLDLVGPGYVNYGQSIAQDFLRLLENFSSPNAPINPIEGQLWYDTSNPNRKVLRINNGDTNSSRWPSANGIYQQANDPSVEYSQNLVDGDVWVDTGNTQLKIRYGDAWTLVGPNVSTGNAKTGNETVNLVSNTGDTYPVILNWVNGKVVEIISYNNFTPRTVIDGFGTLAAGTNLTSKVSAKYNGLTDRARSLEISPGVTILATEVLKNKIPAATRQTHQGTLVVESPQGLIVKRPAGFEMQVYTTSSGGVINYENNNSALKVGIYNRSYIKFNGSNGNVGINTSTVGSEALSVNGAATFKDYITVTSANSTTVGLSVTGRAEIEGNITASGNLLVSGLTTVSNTLTVKDVIPSTLTASLGSVTNPFESVYVKNIGSSTTYVRIFGSVTTATSLETARNFSIEGVIEADAGTFNGYKNIVFTATAHKSLITDLATTSTTTVTQTLMVIDTSTVDSSLQSISKKSFLSDVYPNLLQTGMIMPFVTSSTYAGWLYCNGAEYFGSDYTALSVLLGTNYGTASAGYFRIPNLTTATVSGTNGYPIFYHIKT